MSEDNELQHLLERYEIAFKRLKRLYYIQTNRPTHYRDPQKVKRKIANKRRLLRELEIEIREKLKKVK